MRTIPQCGHYPHWEQPARFAKLVADLANRS
jgi:pimeloyl-ACP methyl ester carboxylesterase